MTSDHHHDRAAALSVQLAGAHRELRRRLGELRTGLGRRPPGGDNLLVHCLSFCAALTAHHQGEDAGMFAQLLRVRPDLAGIVAKLIEDHEMIGSILSRVAELADQAAGSRGPALDEIGRELDGLTAIVESHFNFEERAIGGALDGGTPDTGWSDTGWSDTVFRFRSS